MAAPPPLTALLLLLLCAPARAFDPATEGVIERDNDRIIDTDTGLRDDPEEMERMSQKHKRENDAMLKAKVDFTDRAAVKAFLDEFRRTGKAPEKTPAPAPLEKKDKEAIQRAMRTPAPDKNGKPPVDENVAEREPEKPVEEPTPSKPGEQGPKVTAAEVGAVDGEAPKAKDDQDVAGRQRVSAFNKATTMGENLKKSLSGGPGDMPEGGPGGVGGGPLGGRGGVDPANPRDKQELIAAAGSGFKSAFSALGLETRATGSGLDITRKDGTPATEGELAALKNRIKEEPRALMRHPDLYEHLPREKFLELKEDYASGAKPEAFKHIALAERRDFVRTSSCDSISGGCNPFAKASYKTGDDVPPKELKNIHAYIHEGSDADERFALEDDGPPPEASKPALEQPKRGLGKAGFRPVYARLNQVITAIQGFLGATPEGGSSTSAQQPALATPIAFSFSSKREPVKFSSKPGRATTEVTYPQEYGNRTAVDKSSAPRPLSVPASGLGLGIGLLGALALWRARR